MTYKINGVNMPSPEIKTPEEDGVFDGENAGRDEIGVLHRDVIRAGVRRWDYTHRMISTAQKNEFKALCRLPKVNIEVPYAGADTEFAVVHGKFSRAARVFYDGNEELWDVEVAWIEL